MKEIVSNPYFQILLGAAVSFAGSVVANHMYFGKLEKSRARREAERAYNKLTTRLLHTTISDINHPLHLLPVEIADRFEDLRYALADVNAKFDVVSLVQKAIEQSAQLRKEQQIRQAKVADHALQYSACHEAGHAVARFINGDEILSVDARMGVVRYRSKDWNCSACQGFLKIQGEQFTFNFSPTCDRCTAFVTNLVTANYAGMASTAVHMAEKHEPQDAESDRASVAEFAQCYANNNEKWREITLGAAHRADELVKQEEKAILELRDAVVSAGGLLSGPEAQRIIEANLTKNSG